MGRQQLPLAASEVRLQTYTGKSVAVRGELNVKVKAVDGKVSLLPQIVV